MNTEPMILLYRGRSFHDTLIRWQTWGSVAHAAIWVDGLVYEAVLEGVVRRQWTMDDSVAERYTVDIKAWMDWKKAIAFLDQQIGKPYDLRGLAQFLVRSGEPSPRSWFCSDLVFEAVRQGGVTLVERVARCKVSPEQLRRSPLLIPVS